MGKTIEDKLTPIFDASNEDVEVLYSTKDGKRAVTPVLLCDIDGNPITPGTGGGSPSTFEYKRGDGSTQYPNLDSLYIIETKEDGTKKVTEIANVFTDIDYKLSIDPAKTKWDLENKVLKLTNTDNTFINVDLQTLITYAELTRNLEIKADKTELEKTNANVDTVFGKTTTLETDLSYVQDNLDKKIDKTDTTVHNGITQQNYQITKDDGIPFQPIDYGSSITNLQNSKATVMFTSENGNTGRPGIWGTSLISGLLFKAKTLAGEFGYIASNLATGEIFIGRKDNLNTIYTGLLSRVQLVSINYAPLGTTQAPVNIANGSSHNIMAGKPTIVVSEGVLQTEFVNPDTQNALIK
jgi:hypothetical protein